MSAETVAGCVADRMRGPLECSRLRILIIGGGIAGATLAALLDQRGERPMVIDRAAPGASGGYMLGLLPLGGRVLNGLGLQTAYRERSAPMRAYEIYGRHGGRVRRYDLEGVIREFGDYRGVEHDALLRLLRGAVAGERLYTETTATHLEHTGDAVRVTFDDDSRAEFDLVVGADGIHSWVRRQMLAAREYGYRQTGWGGWVHWCDLDAVPEPDTYRELWAAGWGVGLYPVRDRLGVFLCGREQDLTETSADAYAATLQSRLPDGPFRNAVATRARNARPFFWRMEDCRASVWWRGRVVLLGDAAAAFLPTAGVGASMAMDSAAALADELARADRAHMAHALRCYERRQRKRVERAQSNSRSLARFMFVDSIPGAALRDAAMRFYSLRMLVRSIAQIMEGR